MSSTYEITLQVDDIRQHKEVYIIREIFNTEWNCEHEWDTDNGTTMYFNGVHQLPFATSPNDLATKLSEKIWTALRRYVPITLTSTYLDELPTEEWLCHEDRYDEYINKEK